jgi:multidrug efflux pump subunit AcrB
VDAGQFLLHLRAPTGTRIEETERLADQVNQRHPQRFPADELAAFSTTSAFRIPRSI